jgi:hypothetical protein
VLTNHPWRSTNSLVLVQNKRYIVKELSCE